jgi:hypothetical protein
MDELICQFFLRGDVFRASCLSWCLPSESLSGPCHWAVEFGGLGPAQFGGEPGVRESHFAYFTERYVVHVVIEEVAPDRTVNDKNSVKVLIFAAVR